MGFWDKTKTVVDFKVMTLLEPGVADNEARRWSITYADGNLKTFADMYMVQWRKQYRNSFSINRLKNDGYLPATANGIQLTPIIPLKINDKLVAKDEVKLKRIMKKLNLSADEFWTQLSYSCSGYTAPADGVQDNPATPNEDESDMAWCPPAYRKPSTIDNAYIFIGLYPGIKDNMGAIGGLYETFTLMSAKGNKFALSLKEVYSNYEWKSTVTTHNGRFKVKNKQGNMVNARVGDYMSTRTTTAKVGSWSADMPIGYEDDSGIKPRPPYDPSWNQVTCESNGYFFCPIEQKCLNSSISDGANGVIGGTGGVVTYSKQISETQYRSIKISDYKQEWVVIKNGKHHKKTFGIVTKEDEGDEGARVVVPMEVWRTLKFRYWIGTYENGLSMLVFAHDKQKLKWYQRGIFKVIMYIVMIVVSIIVPGGAITMQAVINAVINSVIAMAIGMALSSLSPELALIAGIVMMVWGAGGGINFDISTLTSFDNFLPMVNKAIDTYNQVEEIQIKSAMETEESALKEIEEKNDAMVEMMKETQGPELTLMKSNFSATEASESPGGQINPEEYFAQKYGAGIYDFDLLYDVDFSISKRIDVKAG